MLEKLYYMFHCSVRSGFGHAERASFLLSASIWELFPRELGGSAFSRYGPGNNGIRAWEDAHTMAKQLGGRVSEDRGVYWVEVGTTEYYDTKLYHGWSGGVWAIQVNHITLGGVLGLGFWNYNENIDLGLSVAGGIAGAFETGGAISLSQLTRGGSVVRLADQTKYLGAVKYVRALGNVGTVLSVAVAGHELITGNDDTHTWVDLGVTGLGVGALIVGGTAAAPFVIAGGLVYGIWSMAGGSDWIDNNWGYNTSKSGGN